MKRMIMVSLCALLAACSPTADKTTREAKPAAPPVPEAKIDGPSAATTAVSLDGEGLRFVDKNSGRTMLLAFGAPRTQAETALANVAGTADDRSSNAECGAGSMDFTRYDAMTLNFQGGQFVGWFLGDEPGARAYSTMSGIAIGTTRAKASESVSIVDVAESTLGEEFSIGADGTGIGGIFAQPGDAAKIDALFAGTNCFFR